MSFKLYPLTVKQVVRETPDAFSIHFANDYPEAFHYKPGMYLTVQAIVNGKKERRAFSLSTSPLADEHLAVTIKCITGGVVSNHLRNTLQPGDTVEVLPPLGNFTLDINAENAWHYVLIGGGSGITPLMSMLRSVLLGEPHSKVSLIYGNRDQTSIIFARELEKLQKQHPGRLHIDHVLQAPPAGWAGAVGMISGKTAADLLDAARNRWNLPMGYYMCGPNPMMEGVKSLLQMAGVPARDIHQEFYTAPLPAADDPGEEEDYEIVTQEVKIKLDGKLHTLTVTPDKSILDAAIAADLDPPYACQEGVCCTCRGKLVEGLVQMNEREGLSDEEIEAGYILTCQSHPLTPDVYVEFG